MTARAAPRQQAFAATLGTFLRRDGRSPALLAHQGGLDSAYLYRLLDGERQAPSRAIVRALAGTLRLTGPDNRALLAAAGYLPCPWTAEHEAVAATLADPRLTRDDLAMFQARVADLAHDFQLLLDRREDRTLPTWVDFAGAEAPKLIDLERERIPLGLV